jgi:broad specificity phosphatase PhoE
LHKIIVMTTFLLIRHGVTDWVGQRLMGWTPGIHVSSSGRAEVESLAESLAEVKLAAVYSSPLDRAMDTATAIARRHDIEVSRNEAFGEIRFGDWTGRELAELEKEDHWRRWNAVRSLTRAPHGELTLEVQLRMYDGLTELQARHPEQNVAVVSHADPIRAVIAHLAGIPLDLALRLRIDTASVSVVRFGDWGPEILGVNQRANGLQWLRES